MDKIEEMMKADRRKMSAEDVLVCAIDSLRDRGSCRVVLIIVDDEGEAMNHFDNMRSFAEEVGVLTLALSDLKTLHSGIEEDEEE